MSEAPAASPAGAGDGLLLHIVAAADWAAAASGPWYRADSLDAQGFIHLSTPERVTLYFTESATRLSTTRTDEQLDAARDDVLARVSRMRAGELTAMPGDACRWCSYRAMCPGRV